MTHRLICLLLGAALLLVPVTGVHAEDGIEPGAAPAADASDHRHVLPLSLTKALQMGAEANISLKEASYNAPIAWQGRVAADALFDTLLTAGAAASHTEQQSTTVFLGTGTVADDNVNAQIGLSKLLRSGGSVSLLYRADRLSAGNPFATVNPAIVNGFSIEASQPILRGAGDVALADVRRAQNNVVAAKANYRTDVEATLLAIAESYWELVFADANLDARNKSEDVARELLDNSEARLKAEVGTPLDVSEARAGVERRVAEVLAAKNLRDTVQDQLLSLILPFGPEVRKGIIVRPTDGPATEATVTPSASEEQRYVDLALKGRPEMLAARADIATTGIDVRVAQDAIRPQLDVIGRVATDGLDTKYGRSFEEMLEGRAFSGSIGLQFSLFLGQRAARANWLAAAWRRRQATLRQGELMNLIVVDVRAALRDMGTARGQLAAGRAEVEATTEALRGERLKLDNGKSTPFRVLQKEEDLTAARTRQARAASDLSIAEARLHRAVGDLADRFAVDAAKWDACCGHGR